MIDESFYFICILFNFYIIFTISHHTNAIAQFIVFCLIIPFTSAQFLVEVLESKSNHRPLFRCEATGANFGEEIMTFSFGIKAIGCAIKTIPELACTETKMPKPNITGCSNNFAVVPRGSCNFSEKAYHVQSASYEALIIYNYPNNASIPMSGSNFSDQIMIPVIMVNYDCMISLMGQYSVEKGYVVTLKASPGYYDLIKYLVPFVVIVGFCFIVLFISLVIRLCRERRRLSRKRLSRSNLKKIPIKKYKSNDREETCAICLEDFQVGDKLRVLPCHHGYHSKCIDPWLTKKRKVCPVCKRKVGPSSNDSSDSDSESISTPISNALTREIDSLLRHEHVMATSSSAEFPYPQHTVQSITNNSGQNTVNKIMNAIKARFSNTNSITNITSINILNDHEDYFDNQPSTSNQAHRHVEFGNVVNKRLQNFKSKCANILNRSSTPHTLLDNEDTVTTVTHDEFEFENTQRNEWITTPESFISTSPDDLNSLTTVYSDQKIITVDIKPSSTTENQNALSNNEQLL